MAKQRKQSLFWKAVLRHEAGPVAHSLAGRHTRPVGGYERCAAGPSVVCMAELRVLALSAAPPEQPQRSWRAAGCWASGPALTCPVLSFQRSAGGSSPEGGEGEDTSKTFSVLSCERGSSLTFSSSLFSVDSDREDGNYCPPVKRERTSSLTQFPPSQSGTSRRSLLTPKSVCVNKSTVPCTSYIQSQ